MNRLCQLFHAQFKQPNIIQWNQSNANVHISCDKPILTILVLNSFSRTFQNHKRTAWHCFINSIRARWNVAQIVQKVRQDATLTFDFVTLVLVAG